MNNENNNEVLSFEELRKKLGMDESAAPDETANNGFSELADDILSVEEKKTEINPSSKDDIVSQIEKKLSETESNEPVEFTENGKTFVDITSQYVKRDTTEVQGENTVVVTQKKKVRTFNEIFSDFFKGFIPLKKDSTKEKIRKIVMDISIIAIIGCCFAFIELYREWQVQQDMQEDLSNKIVHTDDMEDNQYVEAWEELFAQYPDITFPDGMNLKYSYLYAVNQDLVGWLKIDNTNLDVQVVQSDDNDYYLRRDFYQNSSRYGCPYLDFKNDPKYLDDNTVIYGHHMTDGLMFSNLDKYRTLEGYKESPIIEYSTLYDTYYFKVFAAFVTNSDVADDDNYMFNIMVTDFSTDEKFTSFVEEAKKRSIVNTGVSVQPDDKLITLVTCTYDFDDARLIIMGRLLRENEEPTVDTSMAALNTAPKYPQAWYDANNMDNPYKDDEDWTP